MTKTNKLFYLKFVAGVMIVEAYFAYNFSSIKSFSSTTQVHVNELNMTATVEPYFWFTLNAEREMFYNNTKPITGTSNSNSVNQKAIYYMSQLIYTVES